MKKQIFYFSATGNSLSVARKINNFLPEFSLHSVVNSMKLALFENKPRWSDQCQQCYACLQWCPKEAILYKSKTSTVKRYRNPEVTLKDIISSNNK